ncbi:MAG: hypothetical protein NC114_11610 [Ruminococcus flavefaciens]|nr:hypothetical protein [Ruminococcus flavefaciens]
MFAHGLGYGLREPLAVGEVTGIALHGLYPAVYLRYFGLPAPEEVVGPQHVVDGRNEVSVPVRPAEIAREGGQKTRPAPVVAHDQHPEHLALPQLLPPVAARGYVALHLLGGHAAERVRRVVERPCELVGQLHPLGGVFESVQHCDRGFACKINHSDGKNRPVDVRFHHAVRKLCVIPDFHVIAVVSVCRVLINGLRS